MAVALSNASAGGSGNNGHLHTASFGAVSSITITSFQTISSGDTFYLVQLMITDTSAAIGTMTVKLGGSSGTAMTQIGSAFQFQSSSWTIYTFGLVNPPVGAAQSIFFSWNGGASGDDYVVYGASFTGTVTSSVAAATYAYTTNNNTTSNSTITVTGSSATLTGDMAVAFLCGDGSASVNSVNNTEIDIDNSIGTDPAGCNRAAGAGAAITCTATLSGNDLWGAAIVSIKAATAATANFGWNRGSDIDSRHRPNLMFPSPDESRQFFRPSQIPVPTLRRQPTTGDEYRIPAPPRTDWAPQWFVRSPNPVPTTWLPTTGEEDRPPPPWRRPDNTSTDEPQWFVRSPNPVPTQWLPTSGEDVDHVKPIARSPDEPTGYFFPTPGVVSPPSRWLPTTGEEDRPPNPNRVPAPDQPFPWFVRSPNPVPKIWLPISGPFDQEKLPPVQRTDWAVPFFKSAVATVPISGMAWNLPQEQMRPPPAPDQYYNGWSPQVPIALVTFIAQANADDFNPLPKPLFGEMPTVWSPHTPFAVAPPNQWLPTTGEEDRPPNPNRIPSPDQFFPWFVRSPNPVPQIWIPQWDGWERPKPVPPDASVTAFSFKTPTVVSTISGIAWYVPYADREKLPPIKRSPDEPFPWFVRSPVPVPNIWWQPEYDQPPYPPKSDQYRPALVIRQLPVPILGIAWWKSTEVLVYPPSIPWDYHQAWDPQFIVPPVGISGIAWWHAVEVLLEPPPSYRDYRLAWDPQSIIQIIPPIAPIATYYMLEDHWIGQGSAFLAAGTIQQTAPAGRLPSGWTPSPNVDPMDANAVAAYTAAGYQPRGLIRTQYTQIPVLGPNYVWQLINGEYMLIKVADNAPSPVPPDTD